MHLYFCVAFVFFCKTYMDWDARALAIVAQTKAPAAADAAVVAAIQAASMGCRKFTVARGPPKDPTAPCTCLAPAWRDDAAAAQVAEWAAAWNTPAHAWRTQLCDWECVSLRRWHAASEDEDAVLDAMAAADAQDSLVTLFSWDGREGIWRVLPPTDKCGRLWVPATLYAERVANLSPTQLVAEMALPQLSPGWFAARGLIQSASTAYGGIMDEPRVVALLAAYGYVTREQRAESYCSRADTIAKKLVAFTGNPNTRYGRYHEKHADAAMRPWVVAHVHDLYKAAAAAALQAGPNETTRAHVDAVAAWTPADVVATADIEFVYPGLARFAQAPYVGVSVDCLIRFTAPDGTRVTQLAEYKCPASAATVPDAARKACARHHVPACARGSPDALAAALADAPPQLPHPYAKYPRGIPPAYFVQMQLQMGVLAAFHSTWHPRVCWFGVWQPHAFHVTRVPLLPPPQFGILFDALTQFYFDDLLPALVHAARALPPAAVVSPSTPTPPA